MKMSNGESYVAPLAKIVNLQAAAVICQSGGTQKGIGLQQYTSTKSDNSDW